MRCENCRGTSITVVNFESVSAVTYQFCRHCETSAWYTDDGSLEVGHVLEAARTIEPSGRRTRFAAAA